MYIEYLVTTCFSLWKETCCIQ